MPGKGGDLADVAVDGSAGIVTQAPVVEEALAKRGHGGSPRGNENAQGEPGAYLKNPLGSVKMWTRPRHRPDVNDTGRRAGNPSKEGREAAPTTAERFSSTALLGGRA